MSIDSVSITWDEMKLKDIITLVNALKGEQNKGSSLWVIGRSYFIRTVTMHLIGKLEIINDSELLLKDAVWVADSGRFNKALKTGELDEVEPFVNDVIVNRSSIIDATVWDHKIPDEVK
jgi:hypothetical protein